MTIFMGWIYRASRRVPAFLLLALLGTPWGLRGQDEEAPAGPLDLEQRRIVSITFRSGGR